MSTPITDRTVGELVREHPARARVFESLGIDYCCGGKIPLESACQRKNLSPEEVVRRLEQADADGPAGEDYGRMSATALADHVEARHHAYLRDELPRVEQLAAKVARAHGGRDPRLVQVQKALASFAAEMLHHMAKEERVLFPAIRALDSGERPRACGSGSIANPIRQMEAEHDSSGDALARMRELTDGFTPPPGACNSHLALLDALATLERDTHEHVHKENNILFPRAIELEGSRAGGGEA